MFDESCIVLFVLCGLAAISLVQPGSEGHCAENALSLAHLRSAVVFSSSAATQVSALFRAYNRINHGEGHSRDLPQTPFLQHQEQQDPCCEDPRWPPRCPVCCQEGNARQVWSHWQSSFGRKFCVNLTRHVEMLSRPLAGCPRPPSCQRSTEPSSPHCQPTLRRCVVCRSRA